MKRAALSPALVVGALLFLLLTAAATGRYLVLPYAVSGGSMNPSLETGDRILVDLWTYRQRPPRPGEVVLFRGPAPGRAPMIKRVGAPPPFPEDRPRRARWPESSRVSEPGVWMLGDNAQDSADSRSLGPVPLDRLIGRVVWRYWPPTRTGRPSAPHEHRHH